MLVVEKSECNRKFIWERNDYDLEIKSAHNEPSAEQCGRFPEAGIHQTCKRWRLRKETTSKPRTAAAGGALAAKC